ncbi:MAG: flagellar basal body-associated FliL family protein [Pseudomonadota bacterium]
MPTRSEPTEPMAEEPSVAAPRRGRLAILAVALFLAGGGAGYGASLARSASAGVPDGAADADAGDAVLGEGAAIPEGSIFSLGELSVNLRGSGGGRMLRIEVQVEGSAAAVAACGERQSQIRDAMLTVASDYSWGELEGSNGKMRLHDEFLVRINGILKPERVERVYFTQFVVQ